MAKEWTDEEVQAEINEAVRIVREDRFERFARQTLKPIDQNPDSSKNQPPPSGGNNPDPNANNPGTPPKRKSLFWGEIE